MDKKQNTRPKKDFKDDFFVKPKKVRHFQKNDNLSSTSRGPPDFFLKAGEGNKTPNQKAGGNFITDAASSSQTTDGTTSNNTKRPFDKKLYRMKKYSNKYKVQQWEEKRKKAVLHEYHREMKHDQPTTDVMKIYEEEGDLKEEDDPDGKPESSKAVSKPHENSSKAENFSETEFLKQKAKMEQIEQKRRAKMIRSKRMAMKTKRGQPVMKYRVEKLFEQIQELVNDKDDQSKV